jgi:hypothetical protein
MRLVLVLAGVLLFTPGRGVAQERGLAAAPDSASAVSAPGDTTAAKEIPQRDVFDLVNKYILKRRIEPEIEVTSKTGLSWALLPTFSYNPVYGAAFGLIGTGAGRRGSPDAPYSSLSISGNFSTSSQIQAQGRGELFSESADFLTRADFRYLDTERSTWGLGPASSTQQEYPMDFKLYRGYATVYRVVSEPVFIGLGYRYDQFADIVDQRAEQGEDTPFTDYSDGAPSRTVASGVSINVLGDSRDNLVNPSSGYYLRMSLVNYMESLGSHNNWQEMWAEMRVYPHLPKASEHVLAFWLYTWFTFGPAPYLNLPSNGWDTYGRGARGYLQGRIRGTSQIYLESEYRWSLTGNGLLGAVAFVNVTATTDPRSHVFGRADPGAGAGLRIKFNKRSNTNLTIDQAWGQNSQGMFLGMSEVF